MKHIFVTNMFSSTEQILHDCQEPVTRCKLISVHLKLRQKYTHVDLLFELHLVINSQWTSSLKLKSYTLS